MGHPQEPAPALLVIPAFSASAAALAGARAQVEAAFGPIARTGGEAAFDDTAYYAQEMGAQLQLVIWAFAKKVPPGELVRIKHQTNAIEASVAQAFAGGPPRPVNLDPGLLTLDKLALATTKSRSHRLYIGQGIYAESTLRHFGNSYAPWPWTYPSYQKPEVIAFLNELRGTLVKG